jgi:hypothetical protein
VIIGNLVANARGGAPRFEGAIDWSLLTAGAVTITQALGRVLAAETDVPAFNRAGVDGFAARAADTIGAGDPAPCGFCSMRSRARHLPCSVETIEAAGVELRAGGERIVRAAPQTESLGIGEIVDRRCLPDPRFTSTSPSDRRVFNSTIARLWKPAYKRVTLDRVRCAAGVAALHTALSLAQCPKPPAHSKRWTSV